jgi:hypothetical protein
MQPVAADVGDVLAQIATSDPQGRLVDPAGPEPQDLVDMARRTLAARGPVDSAYSELAGRSIWYGCSR